MKNPRILVVGTTSDYIDMIVHRFPDRAMFLTDTIERAAAREPSPSLCTEAVCDLSSPEDTVVSLGAHVDRWEISITGVACFDCESLSLAADIAMRLSMPFPSQEAVLACRDKYECKKLWREAGLPSPRAVSVRSGAEAEAFLRQIAGPVVVKPIAGSGSEYVFLCADAVECLAACEMLQSRLSKLRDDAKNPLYSRDRSEAIIRDGFVVEELIEGPEYSCDFILDGGEVTVLRMARKIPAHGLSFGTTLAYIVPSNLPTNVDGEQFLRQLGNAARAVGLERAICMLDFIVCGDDAVMIEMTPRPGGDCLPPLLLRSAGFDMLGAALDFAEGRALSIADVSNWKPLLGVRMFAETSGRIRAYNTKPLDRDPRVLELQLDRAPGSRIALPPEDYDSRILGYAIVEPSGCAAIEDECVEIAGLLKVEIESD